MIVIGMKDGSWSAEACRVFSLMHKCVNMAGCSRCDGVRFVVAPPPVLLVLAGSGRQSNCRMVCGSSCVTAGQHLSHRVFLSETDMN
ncbi:unnamed protein product [Leuciscus chuanchicus]